MAARSTSSGTRSATTDASTDIQALLRACSAGQAMADLLLLSCGSRGLDRCGRNQPEHAMNAGRRCEMDWLEDQIEAARRSGASTLDLSGQAWGTLPESLGSLTALTVLSLGGNPLTVLPEWLGNLTALNRLDLTANQLTVLPEWLGDLTARARLELGGNRAPVLPEW